MLGAGHRSARVLPPCGTAEQGSGERRPRSQTPVFFASSLSFLVYEMRPVTILPSQGCHDAMVWPGAWRSVHVPPGGVTTRLSSILAVGWAPGGAAVGVCGGGGGQRLGEAGCGLGAGRMGSCWGVAMGCGRSQEPGWVLLFAVAVAAWFRGGRAPGPASLSEHRVGP